MTGELGYICVWHHQGIGGQESYVSGGLGGLGKWVLFLSGGEVSFVTRGWVSWGVGGWELWLSGRIRGDCSMGNI